MKAIKVSDKLYSQLVTIAREENVSLSATLEKLLTKVTSKETSYKATSRRTEVTEERVKELTEAKLKEVKKKFFFCSNCGSVLFPGPLEPTLNDTPPFATLECWRCGNRKRFSRDPFLNKP